MSDGTKDLGLDQQKARSDLAEARAAMAWSDEALLASCAAAESALEAATARGASLDEIGHVAAAAMRAVLAASLDKADFEARNSRYQEAIEILKDLVALEPGGVLLQLDLREIAERAKALLARSSWKL
jgi:hypothetical protein